MKTKWTCIFLTAILLAGCQPHTQVAQTAESATASYSDTSMDSGFDTIFSMREYGVEESVFKQHFAQAKSLFRHYNDLFDIYHDYAGMNNLKTVNDHAGQQAVSVDPAIIELLQEAKTFYTLSNDTFDITSGSLLQVWHTYREEGIVLNEKGEKGKLPAIEELSKAAQNRGWESIAIDADKHTVYIQNAAISLDVGGIAKGFAIEKIARALQESGVRCAAINAGGNVRTIGSKPDGSDWTIGIQNPSGAGSLFALHEAGEHSFVTSGDYERFYMAEDGHTYSHIIDPTTLFPANRFHSVSIITMDSGVADCLSTSLFMLSYDAGRQLIKTYKQAHPDEMLEAIWIMDADQTVENAQNIHRVGQYAVVYTDGLKDAVSWPQ